MEIRPQNSVPKFRNMCGADKKGYFFFLRAAFFFGADDPKKSGSPNACESDGPADLREVFSDFGGFELNNGTAAAGPGIPKNPAAAF